MLPAAKVAVILIAAAVVPAATIKGTDYVLEETALVPVERMSQTGCLSVPETERLFNASFRTLAEIGHVWDETTGNCISVPDENYKVLEPARLYLLHRKDGDVQMSIVKVQFKHIRNPVYIIAGVTVPLDQVNANLNP